MTTDDLKVKQKSWQTGVLALGVAMAHHSHLLGLVEGCIANPIPGNLAILENAERAWGNFLQSIATPAPLSPDEAGAGAARTTGSDGHD